MRTIDVAGISVTIIQSGIEHIPGSVANAHSPGLATFSQIRFTDGTRIENVLVDPMLAVFVEELSEGTWCFVETGSGNTLVGFKGIDGRYHDADPRSFTSLNGPVALYGTLMVLVGIPLSFILIGLPVLALGIKCLMTASRASRVALITRRLRQDPSVVPHALQAP